MHGMKRLLCVSLPCAALSMAVVALPACKKKEEPAADEKVESVVAKATEKKEEKPKEAEKPVAPPAAEPAAVKMSDELVKLAALVPADSTALLGIDVKSLTQAFFWASAKSEFESTPENKANLDKFKACGYEPEKFSAVLVGIDPTDEQVVVALSGTGIGKLSQLECLGKAAAEIEKNETLEPPKMEKRGNRDVLVLKPKSPQPGESTMLVLAPTEDQLVFVPENNLAEIEKQIAGAPGATAGGLKNVLSKANTNQAVWFAGTITKEAAAGLDMVKLGAAQDFNGGFEFRTGLKFGLNFGVDNSASAAAAVDALKVQYQQQKPMLAMFGIPATMADKLAFSSKDAEVQVSLDAGADEVQNAINSVKKLVAGAGGEEGGAPEGAPGDAAAQKAATKKPSKRAKDQPTK
jgi:hypothetical protein